jgi:sugar lactone lactonase YvrE
MFYRLSRFIALIALIILAAAARPAVAQSDLYVCNFNGSTVTRHNASTGALIWTLNVPLPTGAEIGPDGNLYTVGYDAVIRRFNPTTGALLATLATRIARFPDDLHFGPDGNIYIACELGPGILRYDINGNPQPSAGNSGAVFFFGSNRFISTAFGKDGNLYATDYGSNTVWKFSPFGSLLGAFANQNLFGPIDLRFGPDGDLYVANRTTNDVRRFDGATGAFLGVFASGNGLDKSDSLDFGPGGNLYVASRNTDVIDRFAGGTGAFIDTFVSAGLSDPYRIRFFGTTPVTITKITPAAVKVNSAAFQMTIDGTGFAANSTARFNNTLMSVISATSTRIVISVPASLLTSTRVYNVIVSANGKLSNAIPFKVTNTNTSAPPNFKILPVHRTGVDPISLYRYAVLLFENQGTADITNINLSTVRLYYDPNNANTYIQPVDVRLEAGANPAGTLLDTPPGYRLQVRFTFPQTPTGPVKSGVLSVVGTSAQGNFNAGSLFLLFPPSP